MNAARFSRTMSLGLLATLIACSPASDRPAAPVTAAKAMPVPDFSSHEPASTATNWRCGDVEVTTRFDDASLESLTLAQSDQELKLRAVDAMEGARFADDAGNAFWSRPGRVTLTLAGRPTVDCRKMQ